MKRIPMTDHELAQRGKDPRAVKGWFLRPESQRDTWILLWRDPWFRWTLGLCVTAAVLHWAVS